MTLIDLWLLQKVRTCHLIDILSRDLFADLPQDIPDLIWQPWQKTLPWDPSGPWVRRYSTCPSRKSDPWASQTSRQASHPSVLASARRLSASMRSGLRDLESGVNRPLFMTLMKPSTPRVVPSHVRSKRRMKPSWTDSKARSIIFECSLFLHIIHVYKYTHKLVP